METVGLDCYSEESGGSAAALASSASYSFSLSHATATGARSNAATPAAEPTASLRRGEAAYPSEAAATAEAEAYQQIRNQQQQQQKAPVYRFPTFLELERQAARRKFDFLNREMVPCRPLLKLFGFAFLSPTAHEEFQRKLRPDVLVPADELQLPLFQAQFLAEAGRVKMQFPSFYNSAIADALSKDPLSVDVSRHSQFFFSLGLHLCTLLSRFDWPVDHLEGILKKAQHERRLHILTHHRVLDRVFLSRLTFPEKCTYLELQQGALQSTLGGMPFAA